jgi:hypothetical protein
MAKCLEHIDVVGASDQVDAGIQSLLLVHSVLLSAQVLAFLPLMAPNFVLFVVESLLFS